MTPTLTLTLTSILYRLRTWPACWRCRRTSDRARCAKPTGSASHWSALRNSPTSAPRQFRVHGVAAFGTGLPQVDMCVSSAPPCFAGFHVSHALVMHCRRAMCGSSRVVVANERPRHVSPHPQGHHPCSVPTSMPCALQGGTGTRLSLQHPEQFLEQPDSTFLVGTAHDVAGVDRLRDTAAVLADALCTMLVEGVSPSVRVERLSWQTGWLCFFARTTVRLVLECA